MTVHRITMSTDEVATLVDLLRERLDDIKSGQISYGTKEDNQEMVESLEDLRAKLGDEVQKAWGPPATASSSR